MDVSLLNLISTPMAVLNTLGLDLKVGLSSDDPMAQRYLSASYEAYLSIYSPEGTLADRVHLGQIPAESRRLFDVSSISRQYVTGLDHLCVVHRVPSSIMSQVSAVEETIEMDEEPDYSFFRSMIEYSYPQGGNGSVIYETPPGLNAGSTSNTLTFSCQLVLSEVLSTYLVLINHSVNPEYSRIANYDFGIYSLAGERVVQDRVSVGPFGIRAIDLKEVIPAFEIDRAKDANDGISAFTLYGYSDDAALIYLIVNAAPSLGSVAVEHTHPPQTYLFPYNAADQRSIKTNAIAGWKSIFSKARSG
jgi:hypothetical protein